MLILFFLLKIVDGNCQKQRPGISISQKHFIVYHKTKVTELFHPNTHGLSIMLFTDNSLMFKAINLYEGS